MKLFYRKFGEGQPMIILHGLFGQSDNWNTHAKLFAERGFEVYTVDQRNHGLSPHSDIWNFKAMSEDIFELIKEHQLKNVIILGHSMGGKTAMQFAIDHPEYLDKLIVADIAPKYYPMHHQGVMEGLQAVDFNVVKTRKEVEEVLSTYISDFGTKQFLLKNIFWIDETEMAWRFNLKVIIQQIENVGQEVTHIGDATPKDVICDVPALFMRGEYSDYILDEDTDSIKELFPRSVIETIAGAGHWLHAEKPKEFFETVMKFIK
ncbi:MAG: alpha/beta fold hydrolase [Bacteroidetes bacterium]|nr:alpha/beta fold hydrolase [Bacteroidota bacterium]